MKQRRRVLSAGIGAVMIVGSMFAFSGTAHATQGDFTINGTITLGLVVSISGSGSGGVTTPATQTTTSAGSWAGSFTATGTAPPCFVISISAGDTITWTGTPPNPPTATQAINNAVITIDSTGCGAPQGVCILTLTGARNLTSSNFSIDNTLPPTGKVRKGTFTAPAGTKVGNYTITEAPSNDCHTSTLDQQIAGALGAPAGQPANPLPYGNNSNTNFTANLVKTLQTII